MMSSTEIRLRDSARGINKDGSARRVKNAQLHNTRRLYRNVCANYRVRVYAVYV